MPIIGWLVGLGMNLQTLLPSNWLNSSCIAKNQCSSNSASWKFLRSIYDKNARFSQICFCVVSRFFMFSSIPIFFEVSLKGGSLNLSNTTWTNSSTTKVRLLKTWNTLLVVKYPKKIV